MAKISVISAATLLGAASVGAAISSTASGKTKFVAVTKICEVRAPDVDAGSLYSTVLLRTVERKGITGDFRAKMLFPDGVDSEDIISCKDAPDDGGTAFVEQVPGACACSPMKEGAEACEFRTPSGEWIKAPRGMSIPVGQWRGGCVPKNCTIYAGEEGHEKPAACRPKRKVIQLPDDAGTTELDIYE